MAGGWSHHRTGPGTHERVAQGPGYAVGQFWCEPGSPRWTCENVHDERPILVFPHRPVEITHAGAAPVVANPNFVMLYNGRQPYRRRRLHADGDRCLWIGLPAATFASLQGRVPRDPSSPFDVTRLPVDPETILRQRQVVAHLQDDGPPDPLWLHEALLALAARALGRREAPGPPSGATRRRHAEAAHGMERHLSGRAAEADSLTDIAAAVGLSPAHAARIFRAHTGTTLHAYRDHLRLREALSRLEDPRQDLTELALDLGYASHSHFTTRFRRAFGVPPSRVRRRLGPRAGS